MGDQNIYGDAWKTPLDRSGAPGREPGPINVQRWMAQPAYSGVPTFLKQPLCLNQDDLRAGHVDVAVLGAPVDMGIALRGASRGPAAIRAAERALWGPPNMTMHQHVRVDPLETLKVVDYGDAPVDPLSTDNSMGPIRKMVREVVEVGAIPVVLGGDHSILWPDAAALADVYGKGNVGVIHFDAHADCSPDIFGHLASHGTPIRRLIEDEHIAGRNFIQVGLRGYYPDDALFAWMREQGLRSHFMAEIERNGFATVMDRAINEALDGPEYLYISLDIDVLDPSYAPGTAAPEPGGLTNRELLPMIRRLCHETNVVGFEVVEVLPDYDPTCSTVANAHRAILEALTGIAMRRKGLPGPSYLDPAAAGDDGPEP